MTGSDLGRSGLREMFVAFAIGSVTGLFILAAILSLASLLSGCITLDNIRAEFDKPDIVQPEQPAEPDAPEVPEVVTPEPEPEHPAVIASAEMQWFERDGKVVIRIAASRGPRGYSIVTAHGHKDIDPLPPMTEAQWQAANNQRPPQRIVDGFAEWTLDRSGADIAAAALAYRRNSGPVVMLFCKCNTGGQVAYWINPEREYGTDKGRAPVVNVNNYGWEVEL